jgi:hypothetical protein
MPAFIKGKTVTYFDQTIVYVRLSEGYNIVLNVDVPIQDQLRQSGTVMDL